MVIVDRHGAKVEEIALNAVSPVESLEWDKDGDCLAILQVGQSVVPIWDAPSRSLTRSVSQSQPSVGRGPMIMIFALKTML